MFNLKTIELRELHLPLREPFRISSGVQSLRRIFLVRLEDGDGAEGWGECVAGERPNYSPESIDTAWDTISRWLGPRLLGRPFQHPQEVHGELEQDFRGNNMAKAALEMACWELEAAKRSTSLAQLLGGTRKRIEVGISIGIQEDPQTLSRKALQAKEQGYRKIKCKIEPGSDVEFIRAARQAVGGATHLMADANNAYSLDDVDILKRLDEFDLLMIEQPLAWDDVIRHARLQNQLKTPLCLDESITSLERAQDMVELGSGRIINIKPGRVGGFTASKAIHDFCLQREIPVWCGGMLESGIGRAHNVALASLPGFVLPGDTSPSSRYWARDIVDPEWTMDSQGMVEVPWDRSGMGVEVDLDFVEKQTVRRHFVQPAS